MLRYITPIAPLEVPVFVRGATMPFLRQPPPSSASRSSSSSIPPVPLEHSSSSSSSSIPSLTSEASSTSTPDFEALASPLQRLKLHDGPHSPTETHKRDLDDSSAVFIQGDRVIKFGTSEDLTREHMLDSEYRQERRSIGREADLSKGREGKRSHTVASAI